MIQKTQSFTSSDGAVHLTLSDAQKAEVKHVLMDVLRPSAEDASWDLVPAFAAAVVDAQERILDILTTKPSSRPRQRKVNGFVAKKRSTKPTKSATPSSEAASA